MQASKSTRALRWLATSALSASLLAFVGCGDDSNDDGLAPGGGTPDEGGSDAGGGDGGDGGRPEAICLDAAAFSHLVTVDSAATITAQDITGTSSLAAVAPEGDDPRWLLGLGFDAASGVYAASLTEAGNAVEGNLRLAVTHGTSAAYLELRRKP
jgi:hypothetical protein